MEEEYTIMRIKKSDLVKQSNALICAKHNLTKIQLKIILSVIGKIQKDDEDFKDYYFYIKDFFDCIDIDSNKNYTFIKNAIKDILSKPLEIKTEDGVLLCNWLSSADIKKNTGLVKLRFDPALKPYLLQLKERFTICKLEYMLVLNSNYNIRIYELLKQFEHTGVRNITIEEFRYILEIPKSYMINNIKDILNNAKTEISAKTDIEFTYKLEKLGRSFHSINFHIKTKNNKKNNKSNGNKYIIDNHNDARIPGAIKTNNDNNEQTISFEQIATECLKANKCNTIKFEMPYCKVCKNYNDKKNQLYQKN